MKLYKQSADFMDECIISGAIDISLNHLTIVKDIQIGYINVNISFCISQNAMYSLN